MIRDPKQLAEERYAAAVTYLESGLISYGYVSVDIFNGFFKLVKEHIKKIKAAGYIVIEENEECITIEFPKSQLEYMIYSVKDKDEK